MRGGRDVLRDSGTRRPGRAGRLPDPWEMELTTVSEPALETAGPTRAPDAWNSATPAPVQGQAQRRPGGAGFAQATPLDEGVWRDDIRPGQSLSPGTSWVAGGAGLLPGARRLGPAAPRHRRTRQLRHGPLRLRRLRARPGPLQPGTRSRRGPGHRLRRRSEGEGTQAPATRRVREPARLRPAGHGDAVRRRVLPRRAPLGRGRGEVRRRARAVDAARAAERGRCGTGPVTRAVPCRRTSSRSRGRRGTADAGEGGADGDRLYRVLAAGGIGTGSALVVGLGVWTAVARRRAAV